MAVTPIPPAPVKDPWGSYTWEEWFRQIRQRALESLTTVSWNGIDFTGSNITSINTRKHNDLQNIQGGIAAEYYHLANSQYQVLKTAAQTTYTPTLTGVTNVAASTAYVTNYTRIGSSVTVSGKVSIDPTALGAVELGISLPIASTFANDFECAGTAICSAVNGQNAAISADVVNARATIKYTALDINDQAFFFSFTYRII